MTATRRPSCPVFIGPNQRITGRRRTASITPPPAAALSSYRSSARLKGPVPSPSRVVCRWRAWAVILRLTASGSLRRACSVPPVCDPRGEVSMVSATIALRTLTCAFVLGLPNAAGAASPVQIELLEGPIKDLTWDLAKTKVTEQFSEPALALVAVSAKYSERGPVIDRSSPSGVRATQQCALPAGAYRLLLRSRNAARLYVDDRLLLDNAFPKAPVDGHNPVPVWPDLGPDVRPFQPGHQESRAAVTLDGGPHTFRLELIVGGRKLRPELGEPAVAIAAEGQPFRLLADPPTVPFTDAGWDAFAVDALSRHRARETAARKLARTDEDRFWQQRHDLAR